MRGNIFFKPVQYTHMRMT